jgi:hypothetical protein
MRFRLLSRSKRGLRSHHQDFHRGHIVFQSRSNGDASLWNLLPPFHVLLTLRRLLKMTRPVAFRAFTFFVIFAALFASIGIAAYVPVAEVLFLIGASLGAVMFLFFVASSPARAPVPVRIQRRRR